MSPFQLRICTGCGHPSTDSMERMINGVEYCRPCYYRLVEEGQPPLEPTPRGDAISAARCDYVADRIGLDEFDRRVTAIVIREDGALAPVQPPGRGPTRDRVMVLLVVVWMLFIFGLVIAIYSQIF